MKINKNTQVFGSFSKKPGNRGCGLFNAAFEYHQIDAIYKSFRIENIEQAVESARCLGFSGFAVSMPFKVKVLDFVDEISDVAQKCESANTIINKGGKLTAFNTDYLAVSQFIKTVTGEVSGETGSLEDLLRRNIPFYVLGDGGYAKSVIRSVSDTGVSPKKITRKNWSEIDSIKDSIVFNCTPLEKIALSEGSILINAPTSTPSGRMLGIMQASHQYFLYTGKRFPFNYDA